VPRTVLLVAHGPALRTTVRLHLGSAGRFDFVEAGDVPSAVALLRRRGVHLVVADVDEDELRALAAALRAGARRTPAPPLISVGDAADAAVPGVRCAFVKRPVTSPRLRAAIEAVLGAP